MSSGNIIANKWRIYCDTEGENKTMILDADASPPTTCPTNTAHTCNPASASIILPIYDNVVSIREENTPTYGIYTVAGRVIHAVGNSTTHDLFVFPKPLNLNMGKLPTHAEMAGDVVNVYIEPTGTTEGIVGILYADAATGDSVFTVSETVMANILPGYFITLFDGVQQSHLMMVISVDQANGTITAKTLDDSLGSDKAFSTASPTYVQMWIYLLHHYGINKTDTIHIIGERTQGGKYIPADTKIHVVYTRNSPTDIDVPYYFDFFH